MNAREKAIEAASWAYSEALVLSVRQQQAEHVIAAYEAAMREAGYVMAPVEPTVDQFEAAWQEAMAIEKEAGGSVGRDEVVHVVSRYYAAMLAARPEPQQ